MPAKMVPVSNLKYSGACYYIECRKLKATHIKTQNSTEIIICLLQDELKCQDKLIIISKKGYSC